MTSWGWKRAKACICLNNASGTVAYLKAERSRRERRRARQLLKLDPERVERQQRPSGDNWRLA